MYNAEIKEKFISDFSTAASTQNSARIMFNTVEKYEIQWGADICTRKKEELTEIVDQLFTSARNNSGTRMFMMRAYIKWCVKNNIDGACEDFLEFDFVGRKKIINQMVSSPRDLQDILDYVFVPLDRETNSCVFRCYFWLAFSGVNEDDAFHVRTSDIDFESKAVKFRGMQYQIEDESIPAFKQCVELQRFRIYRDNFPDGFIEKNRVDGDTLLRGTAGSLSSTSMRVEITKKMKLPYAITENKAREETGVRLSYSRVSLSGFFFRVYRMEAQGIRPDFTSMAKLRVENKEYKLDKGKNLPGAKVRQLARDYLIDYENWKAAFDL